LTDVVYFHLPSDIDNNYSTSEEIVLYSVLKGFNQKIEKRNSPGFIKRIKHKVDKR